MRRGVNTFSGRVWVAEANGEAGEWLAEAEYRASGYSPDFDALPQLIVQSLGSFPILSECKDENGVVISRNVVEPYSETPAYRCPCCSYVTLHQRAGFDVCPVCYWEDDGQDDHDAEDVRGGPNGGLSLTRARQNFAQYAACAERFKLHVRPPADAER